MDTLIESIASSSTQVQALAVTAGGLIGVFATLTVFYILISLANRIGTLDSEKPDADTGE